MTTNKEMTCAFRNIETDILCMVNQSAQGSYVVISNEKEKLFEYRKKDLDTQLIQYITDRKLLNGICLN